MKHKDLIVTEGAAGLWRYHLSASKTPHLALCGKQTMRTGFPLSEFPIKLADHIPHSNCEDCMKRAGITKEKP